MIIRRMAVTQSKTRDRRTIHKHKEEALKHIESMLHRIIESDDPGKADKICYWLKQYSNYIDRETKFEPHRLKRYKRGEILKVNLGFRVGSEFGGLHYAVVLDKNNSIKSPTITIVPLSSIKIVKGVKKIHHSQVFLGSDIYDALEKNISDKISETSQIQKALFDKSNELSHDLDILENSDSLLNKKEEIKIAREKMNEIDALYQRSLNTQELSQNMLDELLTMKKGSVALISQITTISKLRIYNPLRNDDILGKVKLSDENLNKIDNHILKYYLHVDK